MQKPHTEKVQQEATIENASHTYILNYENNLQHGCGRRESADAIIILAVSTDDVTASKENVFFNSRAALSARHSCWKTPT